MGLTRDEEAEAAAIIAALDRHKDEHPLFYARLWHNDPPKTSQRRCVQDMGEDVTVVLGGNGSGKSELVCQLAVAMALGSDHPDAVEWCKANGFPLDRLPKRGRVIVSSLTHKDSRKVIRPKLDRYAPPGAVWRGRHADDEAVLQLYGEHAEVGIIVCKAARQGREAYQGDWAHLYVLDEEHPEDVFLEVAARTKRPDTGDTQGSVVLAMTPLKGITWVARRFVPGHALEDEDDAGEVDYRTHWVHTVDSPYIDEEAQRRIMSGVGEHERAARLRGEITALAGRVYPHFDERLHVVQSFEPPEEWERYQGIDWGVANPTAILWGALDPEDNVLHIYRERYVTQQTAAQHAEAVQELEATTGETVWMRWADPAQKGMCLEWNHRGLTTRKAKKDVPYGIGRVSYRLQPDAVGKPHLVIHDCCPHTIRELRGYVWDERNSRTDDPDKPLKRDDHAMDALRYLVVGVDQYHPLR